MENDKDRLYYFSLFDPDFLAKCETIYQNCIEHDDRKGAIQIKALHYQNLFNLSSHASYELANLDVSLFSRSLGTDHDLKLLGEFHIHLKSLAGLSYDHKAVANLDWWEQFKENRVETFCKRWGLIYSLNPKLFIPVATVRYNALDKREQFQVTNDEEMIKRDINFRVAIRTSYQHLKHILQP